MVITTTRKRVFVLGTSAHPSGAANALLRLARGLHDRNYDVTACFLYEVEPIIEPDYPYTVIHKTAKASASDYLTMAVKIVWRMQRHRPDVLITFLPLASVLGQPAALLAGVRRRAVSHRVVANTYFPVMRFLDGVLARLRVYNRLIAVSRAVKESCRQYPIWVQERMEVIPNGLWNWKPSPLSKSEARERLGIPVGYTALVALGRLEPQKNPGVLVEALQHLRNTKLIFVGDGALRGELEKQSAACGVSDDVIFLGSVARSRIPDILAAADLYLQPSLFEGHSNAVLEGMSAGLPVLVSDIPEQRETVIDRDGSVAGALIPPHDVEAWVAAIRTFQQEPEKLAAAGAIASRHSKAFSYEVMIAAFEKAIA